MLHRSSHVLTDILFAVMKEDELVICSSYFVSVLVSVLSLLLLSAIRSCCSYFSVIFVPTAGHCDVNCF